MPGTRTTQNVGPVLGSCYPVDVALVADEVNLWERNAKLIVYKRTQGQGKFEAVISDAEGNEHDVIVGATAAVAHASRHTLNEPKPKDTPQTSNDTKGPSAEATPKKNNALASGRLRVGRAWQLAWVSEAALSRRMLV